jgi:hypothetical protein
MNQRKVTFSNLIKLIKNRRPFSILGIGFLFLSIFVLLPLSFLMSNALLEDCEKYDFEKIEQIGTLNKAKITNIASVDNVTVNGKHPVEIVYQFLDHGIEKFDKCRTMDFNNIQDFTIGREISIKTLDHQSKIQNVEPFSFPFYIFYLAGALFFIVGAVFAFIGLKPAFQDYALYKHGIVKEAVIVDLSSNFSPSRIAMQSVLVNYYHLDAHGKKIFGKSKTTDLSIINEKKSEDKIKIFVSPQDEHKSCIVPKLEALQNDWKL